MVDMTVDELYRAAARLRPEEQDELIERLRTMRQASATEDPDLGLLIFDVGDWPEGLSLRREDIYDDEHRAGLR